MPQIHEYTNEVAPGGPGPSREGRDVDTGGVGSAVAALGGALTNDVGSLYSLEQKKNAQQETTSLIAKFSQLNAESSNKLDQDTMDADEDKTKTLSADFMEDYNNKLGALGDNITTPEAQQLFAKLSAESQGSFLKSSMHNQVAKTGQYAVDNYNDTVDSMSTQVRNDPSALDSVVAQHNIAVQALTDTHSIPAVQAAEMQAAGEKQLNKAQFEGYLNLPNGGPQIAQQLLNKGQWDDQFNSDELQKMQMQAKTYVTAAQVEQNRKDAVTQAGIDAKQEAAMQDGLKQLYNNGLSAKDVLQNQDLDYSHQVQLLNMIDRKNKGDIDTDPAVMRGLFARVTAPDGAPGKITSEDQLNQAYIGGQVSLSDLDKLRTEFEGRKTQAGRDESDLKAGFLKVAEQSLVKPSGLSGMPDPDGESKLQAFRGAFLPAYEAQRKQGATANELLTPGNPKYLGWMIKAYMPTAEQLIQSRFGETSNNTPDVPTPLLPKATAPTDSKTVPARLPGESLNQYRARTGL